MSEIALNSDEYIYVSVSSVLNHLLRPNSCPNKCDIHSPLDVPKLVLNEGVFTEGIEDLLKHSNYKKIL